MGVAASSAATCVHPSLLRANHRTSFHCAHDRSKLYPMIVVSCTRVDMLNRIRMLTVLLAGTRLSSEQASLRSYDWFEQ